MTTDKSNLDAFSYLVNYFKERFGEFFTVFPGFVTNPGGRSVSDIELSSCDKCRYYKNCFDSNGSFPYGLSLSEFQYGLFGCGANNIDSFIFDPIGDVYKCILDIGDINKVMFNVVSDEVKNSFIEAEYLIKSEYLDDPECVVCPLVFVCNGGCTNYRITEKKKRCIFLKGDFDAYLEMQYLDLIRGNKC